MKFETFSGVKDGNKYMSFGSMCNLVSFPFEYEYSFEKCLTLLWAQPFFNRVEQYEKIYAFFDILIRANRTECSQDTIDLVETFYFDFSNLRVRTRNVKTEIHSELPNINPKSNILLLHFYIKRNPGRGYTITNIIFPSFEHVKKQLIYIHTATALRLLDSVPLYMHLDGMVNLYNDLYDRYEGTGISEVVTNDFITEYSLKYNYPMLLKNIIDKYNVVEWRPVGIYNINRLTIEEIIVKESKTGNFSQLTRYKGYVDGLMREGCIVYNESVCIELPINSTYLLLFISMKRIKIHSAIEYSFTPEQLVNMMGGSMRILKSMDVESIVFNP